VAAGQNASYLVATALNTSAGSAIPAAGKAVTFDALSIGNPIGTPG